MYLEIDSHYLLYTIHFKNLYGDLLVVFQFNINWFYLKFKLNFAENIEQDAADLLRIGPAEVGYKQRDANMLFPQRNWT